MYVTKRNPPPIKAGWPLRREGRERRCVSICSRTYEPITSPVNSDQVLDVLLYSYTLPAV